MPEVAECGGRSDCVAIGGCSCDALGRILIERYYATDDVDCGVAREVLRRYDTDGRVVATLERAPEQCDNDAQVLVEYASPCSRQEAPCWTLPSERFTAWPGSTDGCLCAGERCLGCQIAGAPPRTGFSATEESLIGTWELDLAASMASMPEEQREMMAMIMSSMRMVIAFNEQGEMSMTISGMPGAEEPQTQTGTFVVNTVTGDAVRFEATIAAAGGPPETQGMAAIFFDGDTVALSSDAGEDSMYFRRVTP